MKQFTLVAASMAGWIVFLVANTAAESSCAGIENPQERLACYDKAHRPPQTNIPTAWDYREFTDKIDDRVYGSANIESTEKNSLLIIRCGGIEPEVSFRFYEPITFNEYVYVRYRVNDLTPSEMETWRLDSDSKAASPIDSKPLFGKMRDNAQLILSANAPRGPGSIFATFKLGAMNEAKQKVASTCAKLKRK